MRDGVWHSLLMPATTRTPLTHLRTTVPAYHGLYPHDVFARTWDLEGTLYFSLGSATGPVHPMFEVIGELETGARVRMAYNYRTKEYVNHTPGWHVEVVRINTKTVTVRDLETGTMHKVEL